MTQLERTEAFLDANHSQHDTPSETLLAAAKHARDLARKLDEIMHLTKDFRFVASTSDGIGNCKPIGDVIRDIVEATP